MKKFQKEAVVMNDLVVLQNDTPVTTSLKVAEVFGKRHDRVLRAIDGAVASLPKIGDAKKAFQQATYIDEQGKPRPMYYLNRDGFTFLVMSFTGKKSAEFKWQYIQAFNAMEKKLTELLIERRNAEWYEVRKLTKLNYRKQTDAIQQTLIPLAREQGSTTSADKFYMTYAKLLNRILNIDSKNRDNLSLGQLYELDKMQEMVAISIKELVANGAEYRQIYKDTKQTLENYAQFSLINQRFIS